MRTLIAIIPSLFTAFLAYSQSETEIINNTKSAYRHLENYLDDGTYIKIIPTSPDPIWTTTYSVAIDRNQNVYARIDHAHRLGISGYMYSKSADQDSGLFVRLFHDTTENVRLPIDLAGASLAGGGGGYILWMPASLITPFHRHDNNETYSQLDYYDHASRMTDTLIQDRPCYVIELTKLIKVTQEMIDKENRRWDSINHLTDLPVEQRGRPPGRVAGEGKSVDRYFIRKEDYMITRVEEVSYFENQEPLKRELRMNPRINVENFATYLKGPQ